MNALIVPWFMVLRAEAKKEERGNKRHSRWQEWKRSQAQKDKDQEKRRYFKGGEWWRPKWGCFTEIILFYKNSDLTTLSRRRFITDGKKVKKKKTEKDETEKGKEKEPKKKVKSVPKKKKGMSRSTQVNAWWRRNRSC